MRFHFSTMLHGALAGIALNSVICLAVSYGLHLGYYAPCFTALDEMCGGELNAAFVQMCAFALAGAAGMGLIRLIRFAGRKLCSSQQL